MKEKWDQKITQVTAGWMDSGNTLAREGKAIVMVEVQHRGNTLGHE